MFIDSSTSTSTSFSASTSGSTSTTSYIQSFYQKVRELAAEAGLTPLHLAAYSGLKKNTYFFHIISSHCPHILFAYCPSRPNHPFNSAQSSDSITCRKCYSTSAIATWFMPLSLIVGEYQWPIYQRMITQWVIPIPPPFPLLQYVPVIMDNRKKIIIFIYYFPQEAKMWSVVCWTRQLCR